MNLPNALTVIPKRGDDIEKVAQLFRADPKLGIDKVDYGKKTTHRVLKLAYSDEAQRTSTREVEPLCLAFWGGAWTLGAWCRLRGDFRNFRPDRIATFEPTGETFAETTERGLSAYLGRVGGESDGIF